MVGNVFASRNQPTVLKQSINNYNDFMMNNKNNRIAKQLEKLQESFRDIAFTFQIIHGILLEKESVRADVGEVSEDGLEGCVASPGNSFNTPTKRPFWQGTFYKGILPDADKKIVSEKQEWVDIHTNKPHTVNTVKSFAKADAAGKVKAQKKQQWAQTSHSTPEPHTVTKITDQQWERFKNMFRSGKSSISWVGMKVNEVSLTNEINFICETFPGNLYKVVTGPDKGVIIRSNGYGKVAFDGRYTGFYKSSSSSNNKSTRVAVVSCDQDGRDYANRVIRPELMDGEEIFYKHRRPKECRYAQRFTHCDIYIR
jgi:hypothetical protein